MEDDPLLSVATAIFFGLLGAMVMWLVYEAWR